MASVPPSSVPASVAGSTIEDPDMHISDADDDADDERRPALERSSPQVQSSPPSHHGTEVRLAPSSKLPSSKRSRLGEEIIRTPYSRLAAEESEAISTDQEEDSNLLLVNSPGKRLTGKHKKSASPSAHSSTAANTVGTRRRGDGSIGSVYSGSKIRHLKKDDGVPLWRIDIQYEFLRLVFEDTSPVFYRQGDGQPSCTFADVYIDAMARSSKTSKVLKDKLNADPKAAQNMAMICLLVNVGRMNTTLNFFPEMKAQLRTYHSIPALQASQDQTAYKQLQDAPRLKSILKGASEDTDEPRTIEEIKSRPVPRTNPVNLLFVLSQYAPRITDTHFIPPFDFFDLFMKPTVSSQSRASAFLWLMWWYLQSDFSSQAALDNPFGKGIVGSEDALPPLKVPHMDEITEEQGAAENVDPPDEVTFGEEKQLERKRLLENDEPDNKVLKRVKKSAAGDESLSDYESPRASLPRANSPAMRDSLGFAVLNPAHNSDHTTSRLVGQADSLKDDWEPVDPHPGRGRYKRIKKDRESSSSHLAASNTSSSGRALVKTSKALNSAGTLDTDPLDLMQAQPPGASHPILQQYGPGDDDAGAEGRDIRAETPLAPSSSKNPTSAITGVATSTTRGSPAPAPTLIASHSTATNANRRPRPLTQHQIAIEATRRQQTESLLARKKKEVFLALRQKRQRVDFVAQAARRIRNLPLGYDSEDGETSWGMGGLGPNPHSDAEDDDFGEEAEMWIRVVEKVKRRVERWSGDGGGQIFSGGPVVSSAPLAVNGVAAGFDVVDGNTKDAANEEAEEAAHGGKNDRNATQNSNKKSNKKRPSKPKVKKEPAVKPKKGKVASKVGIDPDDASDQSGSLVPGKNADGDRVAQPKPDDRMDVDTKTPAKRKSGSGGKSGNNSDGGIQSRNVKVKPMATSVGEQDAEATRGQDESQGSTRLDDIDKSLLAEKSEDGDEVIAAEDERGSVDPDLDNVPDQTSGAANEDDHDVNVRRTDPVNGKDSDEKFLPQPEKDDMNRVSVVEQPEYRSSRDRDVEMASPV